MSRSKKDGRGGGGHRGWATLRDAWSKRCPRVSDCRLGAWAKKVTSRFDRRVTARRSIREQMVERL